MEIIDIIRDCTIANGNIIKLPNIQLERADYMKVKKLFESYGGKWKGGKCQGFLFNTTDASTILARIQEGNLSGRKKKSQALEIKEIRAKVVGFGSFGFVGTLLKTDTRIPNLDLYDQVKLIIIKE